MVAVPEDVVEKVEIKDIIDQDRVIVRGFLVVSKLPSPNLLKTFFPKVFEDVKIGYEGIQLVRGYFYNKVMRLAQKFYDILDKYAVNVGFGYIVPYENVEEFLKAIDELKAEYEKYQNDLENFIKYGKIPEGVRKDAIFDDEYIKIVKRYLEEHGIEDIKIPDVAGRVYIKLIPFSLDVSYLVDYIDENVRRRVELEIEDLTKDAVKKVEEAINEKVNIILKKLENYQNRKVTKKFINSLKKDIEYIETSLRALGADTTRVRVLRNVIEDIEQNRVVVPEHSEMIRAKLVRKQFLDTL